MHITYRKEGTKTEIRLVWSERKNMTWKMDKIAKIIQIGQLHTTAENRIKASMRRE